MKKKKTPDVLTGTATIPIYEIPLEVHVCKGDPETHPKLVERFDIEPGEWTDTAAMSYCFTQPPRVAIIMSPRGLTHNVIAHEITHITGFIMETIGHAFTPGNHEPHAYLTGAITDVIYTFLKRHRIKVK